MFQKKFFFVCDSAPEVAPRLSSYVKGRATTTNLTNRLRCGDESENAFAYAVQLGGLGARQVRKSPPLFKSEKRRRILG